MASITASSRATGTVAYSEILSEMSLFGQQINETPRRISTRDSYVLAARINGKPELRR